jgi:hypothetical protein
MADSVWTWTTILKFAFTTGLIGAVFNQGFALLKDSIRRRRRETQRARGFALKLVGMLTAYAQACNSLIDSNDYEQEHGALGSYELPELAPYPSGPWELLPPRLAAGLEDLRK